jgi:hypothetical protein
MDGPRQFNSAMVVKPPKRVRRRTAAGDARNFDSARAVTWLIASKKSSFALLVISRSEVCFDFRFQVESACCEVADIPCSPKSSEVRSVLADNHQLPNPWRPLNRGLELSSNNKTMIATAVKSLQLGRDRILSCFFRLPPKRNRRSECRWTQVLEKAAAARQV